MKTLLVFAGLAGAMVLLAGVAIGLLVSISTGRASAILIAVFSIDSVAVLVIAGHLLVRKERPRTGPE